jgi:GABA permease
MEGLRILVVANETCAGRRLLDELAGRHASDILVVAPALNSRLRHLFADVDDARAAAEERLAASIAALRARGLDARGAVGDSDPVLAIEDALAEFDADEVIISTHPPQRSNWLERGVVERARERIDVPVSHVVVDLEQEQRQPSR